MKTTKKDIIDAKFDEVQREEKQFNMSEVCSKCGHHTFCKYEGQTDDILSHISEEMKRCELTEIDPFVLVVQCKGFCQVAEEPMPKKE